MAAFVSVNGVLVAGEFAAVEALVCVLGAECEGLGAGAEGVGDVEVVEFYVGGPEAEGRCCVVIG